MSQSLNFQSIIMKLQDFWAGEGCLIWQPYYTQVGAGTMNPATSLRVLGPEPWNVAYVEPSVRPDDGRYGDNPNRLQQHTQFQVILKPDPGDPQEKYLRSLETIGIDPRVHDIRFVEDNWTSPALGAWGLGWEVWLDGQEITQFTYFQQSGGQVLNPVAVEITYGLERIAMTLQDAATFRDIQWSPTVSYGDVHLQGEREHSTYYFEVADVERLREMYALFEAEARLSLEKGLVLPAHDYVLKCSHTFNILDTRGAIGVTERQQFFGRMRDLARRIAERYLEQRGQLDYPFLKNAEKKDGQKEPSVSRPVSVSEDLTGKADFLFEVGTEELTVTDLSAALQQWTEKVPLWLNDLRLEYDQVSVWGTPRRLVIYVKNLSAVQPDQELLVKGPPAARAFNADGSYTPAAVGFARSKGLDVSALTMEEIDGGTYAVARLHEKGKPAVQVLPQHLAEWISHLKFDKTMRWNSSDIAFSRPIRWLLAWYGRQPLSFSYAGLQSGNITRGLRFYEPAEKAIETVEDYFDFMKSQGIILDPVERRDSVRTQVIQLMEELQADAALDDSLLDETSMLVEVPTAFIGKFDPQSLKLPKEVLISVMKKHQRYFPVVGKDGVLLPFFVAVRNGDKHGLDVVAEGNGQVVRARFADAAFFIQEDLKTTFPELLERLNTLAFQHKLGSMMDKSRRIEALSAVLADGLGLTAEEKANTLQAARLCKADLVSHMVVEMTSLQGIMGKYYAEQAGLPQEVCDAIYEHYLPRYSGDRLPAHRVGLTVGLADRLDSLAGLFAAGLAPSGTKDPFALRRCALGLVQNLVQCDLDFHLQAALQQAAKTLPIEVGENVLTECADFIAGRLRSQFQEQGYHYDIIDAVMSVQADNPAAAARAVKELGGWVQKPEWSDILPAFARCVRITRDQKQVYPVQPAALKEPAEKNLLKGIEAAESQLKLNSSISGFLTAFLPLVPVINDFFNRLMVMSEDPVERSNRLGLLQRTVALANGFADFSKLEGF